MQNTVASLKSRILAPPKILGWLRYCSNFNSLSQVSNELSVSVLKFWPGLGLEGCGLDYITASGGLYAGTAKLQRSLFSR